MALSSKHPKYDEFLPQWQQMSDAYAGQRVVKSRGQDYLAPTSGQYADGMNPGDPGHQAYSSYKMRAVYPDLISDAVEKAIGVMHQKPAVIELPPQLEEMLENATTKGESLQMLLRRINEAQLVRGRLGLMLDLPATPQETPRPYIAVYSAESIINWDDGPATEDTLERLNLVVLNESENVRDADFEWKLVTKYRVLMLGDPTQPQADEDGEVPSPPQGAVYSVGVFIQDKDSLDFNPDNMQPPVARGTSLDKIPFVFINSKDILPDPDDPPLYGLSELALTIYRTEADYRQCLFMQGQDTLVISGGHTDDDGKPMRVGAGAVINLPMGGEAKFIGVESQGLTELREALQNDYKRGAAKGGELTQTVSREAESGDALQTRVAAQTATLKHIAKTGAFGLQSILRMAAEWIGADPEAVVVEPNLDFADKELDSRTLLEWTQAKNLGAPLSWRTIHENMAKRGLTEMDFEEEQAEIEGEEPVLGGTDAGGDVDNPPDDEA